MGSHTRAHALTHDISNRSAFVYYNLYHFQTFCCFYIIQLAGGTASMQQLKERLEKDLLEVYCLSFFFFLSLFQLLLTFLSGWYALFQQLSRLVSSCSKPWVLNNHIIGAFKPSNLLSPFQILFTIIFLKNTTDITP